ncbi:MAG: hypothetical protein RLZZ427_1815 [Pseudomonadota bacterium]|jgi:HD-GYP domain-containing protein (c-di-GMP phosphodiesterase class II)
MKTEYPIMALLGIELFLRLGLLLPYIGKQGRDLIAITTIYRPIALAVFIVHTCVTMALVDYPYPPLPGLLVLWGLTFFGLEIRRSRGARTNVRAILGAMSGITAFFVIGTLVAPTWIAVIRPAAHDAALVPFLFWLSWEALQAWRGSRNAHYLVAGLTMFCALIALIAFTHIYSRYPEISLAQIGYHVEAIIWLRFLGTGLLSLTLLALNNVYSQRLWRAAVAKRRAKEVSLIAALGEIARVRDNETGQHLVRVRLFVRTLARNLARKQQLAHGNSAAFLSALTRASALHDLGKVAIPDSILLKPGRLNPGELEVMRTHAGVGAEILRAALDAQQGNSSKVLVLGAEIAASHHENWDGSGYPAGLSGTAIPQSARIVALADVYDALTSHRPYKQPWTHAEAQAHIIELSGTKFDPEIVAAFCEEAETFNQIATRFRDGKTSIWA